MSIKKIIYNLVEAGGVKADPDKGDPEAGLESRLETKEADDDDVVGGCNSG